MTEALIVFTTFANEQDAVRVVRALVDERLVACGNLLPGARSIYRGQNGVEDVVDRPPLDEALPDGDGLGSG